MILCIGDVDQNRLHDFLAVGPPRTGTTWLELMFARQASLPAGIKEAAFFTKSYELGRLPQGSARSPTECPCSRFWQKGPS